MVFFVANWTEEVMMNDILYFCRQCAVAIRIRVIHNVEDTFEVIDCFLRLVQNEGYEAR